MIYHFNTQDENAATAALLIYAIYRSRNKQQYKVTPDLWNQIARFVKSSAKRARTLPDFVESLMPKLACGTINPKWIEVGVEGRVVAMGDGAYAEFPHHKQREFMIDVINTADHRGTIDVLYKNTEWAIGLVRDRLEREKPALQVQLIRQWRPWEKFTGPKTEAGKMAVSKNAYKGRTWRILRGLSCALRKQNRRLVE